MYIRLKVLTNPAVRVSPHSQNKTKQKKSVHFPNCSFNCVLFPLQCHSCYCVSQICKHCEGSKTGQFPTICRKPSLIDFHHDQWGRLGQVHEPTHTDFYVYAHTHTNEPTHECALVDRNASNDAHNKPLRVPTPQRSLERCSASRCKHNATHVRSSLRLQLVATISTNLNYFILLSGQHISTVHTLQSSLKT